MSTNLAIADVVGAPSRTSRGQKRRPDLVEVTPTKAQRRARPRVLAALIAVGALGLLLVAQLGISMMLSKGAYQLDSLTSEQTSLSRTQQKLTEKLQVLQSPQNLSNNAQALGMIANSTPVYLDPKSGKVYGTPTPATASESTGNTANQVQNQLLDGVPLAAKKGDTDTSKQQKDAAGAASNSKSTSGSTSTSAATDGAEKAKNDSASDASSSTASVPSETNQLQAPTTR